MSKAFHVSVSPYRFIFTVEDGKGRGNRCSMICAILAAFLFVSFSSIALSRHPSHILCGNVVFLLFVLFPVLVWNSPRFKTFNEKIIQLEKKPSCVQWSNYSRRIFIFLKRFRLRLHGLLFLYIYFFLKFLWDLTHADCIKKMKRNTKSINMS